MHSFKIVAILKKWGNTTRMEYSYVPYKWEHNGVVKWPNENATKLRKDASSEPQLGWMQFKSKLKKNLIMNLDEAELWETEFINANNTDAEENMTISNIKRVRIIPNSNIINGSEYDGMFEEASAEIPALDNGNSSTNNVQVVMVSDNTLNSQQEACFSTTSTGPSNNLSNSDDFSHYNPTMPVQNEISLNDAIVKILEEQKQIFNEIQNMRIENEREYQKNKNELQAVKLTVDTIYKLLKNFYQNPVPVQSDSFNEIAKANVFADKFEFPLKTVEEISKFNQEMLNSAFKEYLINTYSSIGGETGNEDGKIVAKKLAELFFTTQVLTLCSWTGVSRTKNVEKKAAFQTFEEIFDLFFKLIHKADSRWTVNLNEKFFKTKTLRHATQTNNAKIKKNAAAVDSSNIEQINNGDKTTGELLQTMLNDGTAATTESTHSADVSNSNSIAISATDNTESTSTKME